MIKTSNNKQSFNVIKNARHDTFLYAGFNYEHKQLKKSVSSYLLRIPMAEDFIYAVDTLVFYITEKTKMLTHLSNYAMKSTHTKFR